MSHLFDMLLCGSNISRDFASCLGITNASDVNQHEIDPAHADALRRPCGTLDSRENRSRDLDRLTVFAGSGFRLSFGPNG